MRKNLDKKGMLPPQPDYCCKKCKESGYLSEMERSDIEYGKEVKCPECGGDLKIFIIIEKK